MEKERLGIKAVTYTPTSTGKDKWKVETDKGNFSVWDGKLAEELNAKQNENVVVTIRLSPDPKYKPTITGIDESKDLDKIYEAKQGIRSNSGQEQGPLHHVLEAKRQFDNSDYAKPSRDKSIIAQCLVKAVMRDNKFDYDIKEAVEMYKLALELLG